MVLSQRSGQCGHRQYYAAAEQAKTAASMDPSNPAYRNLVQQLSYGTYRYDSMSENYGGSGAWEAAVPILSASAFSVRVSTLSAAADEVSG